MYNLNMQRNFITDALVLSVSPAGENNRSVCILSADRGILWGILYGGPKSKMRSLVSPFNRGKMYLYHDAVKKTVKITDFDVEKFHYSFRESLFKSWAASLACELVIKTKAAGSPEECWNLANGFLDGLDLCNEKAGKLGLIRFLWRYLGLLGVQPDTDACPDCQQKFLVKSNEANAKVESVENAAAAVENEQKNKKTMQNVFPVICGKKDDKGISLECSTINTADILKHTREDSEPECVAVFSLKDAAFHCADCAAVNPACKGSFRLPAGSQTLHYFSAISEKSPGEVRAIKISGRAVSEMKQIVFYLIELAVGQKLKTIESGFGIL